MHLAKLMKKSSNYMGLESRFQVSPVLKQCLPDQHMNRVILTCAMWRAVLSLSRGSRIKSGRGRNCIMTFYNINLVKFCLSDAGSKVRRGRRHLTCVQ